MPSVRNLDHSLPTGVKRSSNATRSVQSLGTTANARPVLGNPEWTADLEYVWRMRTSDALQLLHARGKRQRRAELATARELHRAVEAGDRDAASALAWHRVKLARSAEWAEHRAQAMALPRQELVATCGERYRRVVCGCGPREFKVGCDQPQLCATCRKRHWRRWRKRITRAMDAHVRAARGAWHGARLRGESRGMQPGVYLVTLTVPHSGSIVMDRETIAKGWRRLTKIANARNWWGAYAMTYEVTPGTAEDGSRGHVHVHLAAVSSWIPYDELREAWHEFTGAEVIDVSPPRSGTRESAANYLAKYVTKGVDPAVFTGQKAGEILVALRGKRKVTTSRAFWTPTRHLEVHCKVCGERHQALGAPPALVRVAPGPVLQAYAERVGWWVPRGGVQVKLKLEED